MDVRKGNLRACDLKQACYSFNLSRLKSKDLTYMTHTDSVPLLHCWPVCLSIRPSVYAKSVKA